MLDTNTVALPPEIIRFLLSSGPSLYWKMETSTYRITSTRRDLQTDPSSLPPLLRAASVSGNSPDPLQAVFPVSPDEPVVPADQNREPPEAASLRLEVDNGKAELPVGAAHVA